MLPPRSLTACSSLPPEGAAAPAAWQSLIRPRLEIRGRYFFYITIGMTVLLAAGV